MTPPADSDVTPAASSATLTAPGDDINIDSTSAPGDTAPDEASQVQRRLILWLVVALTVASAVFAGWAVLRWWQADHDESLALAHTRDQVLIAAHTDIETLTSLDHREVDEGLDAWLEATTGDLHDQLAKVSDEDREAIEDAGAITTGRVVEAAVIDLSAGGDSASVIASVELSVEPEEGDITLKRNRFTADLLLVDGAWKLARLDQVPVVSP